MNTEAFERTLSEAFEHGTILRRELRLNEDEAAHLRASGASVAPLAPGGDKLWYEISFRREDMNGTGGRAG